MAMTKQQYEERISAAQDKIAKIDKRIQKWEDAKSDEKFAKHYDWLQADTDSWALGWDGNNRIYGTFQEFKNQHYAEWIEECDHEIKYANRDKEEVLTLINKYRNSLELLKEKDAKPVIQIFKDFFDNWKAEILEYVKPLVDEYYEINTKRINMLNSRYNIEKTGFSNKEEFELAYKELSRREKDIISEPIVKVALDKGLRRNDSDFIKYLDDYMNARYLDLVGKVTEIVGEIDDVSNLNVGMDGTLNGRIYGDKGGAKIETIVAGGYNTNIIVNVKHGQIRHYRVLVHPIK